MNYSFIDKNSNKNNEKIEFDCILNPNYSKDIWFNIKNDYIVKTEYLGNNIYRESYNYSNNLGYIINHEPPKK